jgi:uncharacterized protein (TIGR02996 family)
MTVYFVWRNGCLGPAGKRLWRFQEDSLLDWFANRWKTWGVASEKRVAKHIQKEFGLPIPFLARLFTTAATNGNDPPTTAEELAELAEQAEVEEALCEAPNCLQVCENDEQSNDLCYYFFDDHFLSKKAHQTLAAYLLHEDWRLPTCPDASSRSRAWTEDVSIDIRGEKDIEYRFPCRLEDLARHLLAKPLVPPYEAELPLLRALLTVPRKRASELEQGFLKKIQAAPKDQTTWQVFSDWLQEQGEPPAGLYLLQQALSRIAADSTVLSVWNDIEIEGSYYDDPTEHLARSAEWVADVQDNTKKSKGLVHVEQHLAQLTFPSWTDRAGDYYLQWILFDNVWASAHKALAESLGRYAERWDVLTVD